MRVTDLKPASQANPFNEGVFEKQITSYKTNYCMPQFVLMNAQSKSSHFVQLACFSLIFPNVWNFLFWQNLIVNSSLLIWCLEGWCEMRIYMKWFSICWSFSKRFNQAPQATALATCCVLAGHGFLSWWEGWQAFGEEHIVVSLACIHVNWYSRRKLVFISTWFLFCPPTPQCLQTAQKACSPKPTAAMPGKRERFWCFFFA